MKYLNKNETYTNKLKSLDLSTESGMIAFKKMTEEEAGKFKNSDEFVPCAPSLVCVAYAAVVGLSYVAVAYSVVAVGALWVWAAAWGPITPPQGGGSNEELDIFVSELNIALS